MKLTRTQIQQNVQEMIDRNRQHEKRLLAIAEVMPNATKALQRLDQMKTNASRSVALLDSLIWKQHNFVFKTTTEEVGLVTEVSCSGWVQVLLINGEYEVGTQQSLEAKGWQLDPDDSLLHPYTGKVDEQSP